MLNNSCSDFFSSVQCDYLQNKLRDEVRIEVRNEIKNDIRNEVRNEMISELSDKFVALSKIKEAEKAEEKSDNGYDDSLYAIADVSMPRKLNTISWKNRLNPFNLGKKQPNDISERVFFQEVSTAIAALAAEGPSVGAILGMAGITAAGIGIYAALELQTVLQNQRDVHDNDEDIESLVSRLGAHEEATNQKFAILDGYLNSLKSSLQFTCDGIDELGDDPPADADKYDCCVTDFELICFDRLTATSFPDFDLTICAACPADVLI